MQGGLNGKTYETQAPVTGSVALGERLVSAHGDGCLRLFRGGELERAVSAHSGVILDIARVDDQSVVTGGEDGRCLYVDVDGGIKSITDFDRRWVDCVACHKGAGYFACSAGREVRLVDFRGNQSQAISHPSTVSDLAFDSKGERLAVTHYGGVTIWRLADLDEEPLRLEWTGSHLAVSWSPDDQYLVTAMQENALHGWRLRDQLHMAMSGYSSKPRSLAWVGDKPHLATSGADQLIFWPFDAPEGPMGQTPLSINYRGEAQVACVNAMDGLPMVFAGLEDGTVILAEPEEAPRALLLRGPTGSEVTTLVATHDLSHFLVGDDRGGVFVAPLKAS